MQQSPNPLNWAKNTNNGEYFDLLKLDLNSAFFATTVQGVYVIWYVAPGGSNVIEVGSGNVAGAIRKARSNPQILAYAKTGQLKVSWALVQNAEQLEGIEAYLYNAYSPLLGVKPSSVTPIDVILLG